MIDDLVMLQFICVCTRFCIALKQNKKRDLSVFKIHWMKVILKIDKGNIVRCVIIFGLNFALAPTI